MLNKLIIKNIALIESAEISFSQGFNVLSGETGSGKSVIIESLNFVLGAKADRTFIRSGADECYVCAEFDVSDCDFSDELFEEIDAEREEILIITRKFSLAGKNSIKINGVNVTAGMLRKFTARLVDVHGQSDHFELLSTVNQLKLLDKFGGEEIDSLKKNIKSLYENYKENSEKLKNLGGEESERLVRLDILNFQISEIENLGLKENEEEELIQLRDKLLHQQKIIGALNAVKSAINDEGGANDILANALRVIATVASLGKEYSDFYERFQNAYSELSDIADCADTFIDSFDYTDYDADSVEERLDKIKTLKRKYGNSYSEINDFYKRALEEREKLENFNEIAAELLVSVEKIKKDLYEKYSFLSESRRKYGKIFSENVLKELKELAMNNANFEIKFSDKPDFENCKFDSANGFDNIDFMFSANLGEPLKPLSNVISGGEMSRFMLSVKAQTAKFNDISTFIFDEIDAGISGKVARVVAEKLCRISRSVQVIAISHLPQIASFADNNLYIFKNESGETTYTGVKNLDENGKVVEVARLVGGSAENESAVALAKSLIDEANRYKSVI